MWEHAGINIEAKTNDEVEANLKTILKAIGREDDDVEFLKWGWMFHPNQDKLESWDEEDKQRWGMMWWMQQLQNEFYAKVSGDSYWDDLTEQQRRAINQRSEWLKVSQYAGKDAMEFVAEKVAAEMLGYPVHSPEGWDKMAEWIKMKADAEKSNEVHSFDIQLGGISQSLLTGCGGLLPPRKTK